MNPTENDVNAPALDVNRAVDQLRTIVCALGVGLMVLSVAVNVFVFKQNRNLSALAENRRAQVQQLEVVQKQWLPAVNELVQYSQGRPELQAVLRKCGVSVLPTK